LEYSDEFPQSKMVGNAQPGNICIFRYGAKYKKQLPYWDRNPLCYIISSQGSVFYGLNFHYIVPANRMAIYKYIDDGGNPSKILGYHKYLKSYMDSPFLQLYYGEYEKALSYGMEDFARVVGSQILDVDPSTIQGSFYKK